jgi:hypothetical protein
MAKRKRKEFLMVALTEEEKAKIKADSDNMDMTMSEYCRAVLIGVEKKVPQANPITPKEE